MFTFCARGSPAEYLLKSGIQTRTVKNSGTIIYPYSPPPKTCQQRHLVASLFGHFNGENETMNLSLIGEW